MNFKRGKKAGLVLLAVVIIAIANHYFSSDRWADGLRAVGNKPLAFSQQQIRNLRYWIGSWLNIQKIVEENNNLVSENQRLEADNLKLSGLAKENVLLRAQLDVAKKQINVLVMGRLSQFNTAGTFSTAFLDQGEGDGLKPGQPVIFGGNILLGVVKEVYAHRALIYLSNDPRLSLNVKVADATVIGKTEGGLEKGIFLNLITNQEEVKEGQLVVTSGLDGLPSLLLVGKVANVQTKNGALFKEIRIEPSWGRHLSEDVFIIIS